MLCIFWYDNLIQELYSFPCLLQRLYVFFVLLSSVVVSIVNRDEHARANVFSKNLNCVAINIYAGCMAALDAEHYLQEIGSQEGKSDWALKLIGIRLNECCKHFKSRKEKLAMVLTLFYCSIFVLIYYGWRTNICFWNYNLLFSSLTWLLLLFFYFCWSLPSCYWEFRPVIGLNVLSAKT